MLYISRELHDMLSPPNSDKKRTMIWSVEARGEIDYGRD
jgi:hypothetical protein